MANPNEGVLDGFQCPECQSFGPFKIAYTTMGIFTDDGLDEECGDNEWDDSSYCQCIECDHEATVGVFCKSEGGNHEHTIS